jgi:hypothetical protein
MNLGNEKTAVPLHQPIGALSILETVFCKVQEIDTETVTSTKYSELYILTKNKYKPFLATF